MRETAMQSQSSKFWLNIGVISITMTWVLIPVAIAINIAIGQIVVHPQAAGLSGLDRDGARGSPLWSLGGCTHRALSNIIWGVAVDPNALPWWPVAFFIGLVAGLCANAGLFKKLVESRCHWLPGRSDG